VVNAKNLPIFYANRVPLANALNFIGYTELFLTISKPDICQHKSLGKLATDFFIEVFK
jgi:hypothetical protein